MQSDKVKIRYHVQTDKVGSKTQRFVEIDRNEWEEMPEEERDLFIMDHMFDLITWDYEVVEK